MTTLTPQQLTVAGLTPTYTAATAADDFVVTGVGPYWLHIKNAGGSPDSCVVDDPNSTDPGSSTQFNPDVTVTVPATTGDKLIKLDVTRFKNAGSGKIAWTNSFTTSVTAAVFYL